MNDKRYSQLGKYTIIDTCVRVYSLENHWEIAISSDKFDKLNFVQFQMDQRLPIYSEK
jgi:hypothetical protein